MIVALDGQSVESMPGLWRLLQEHAVGDEVVLAVLQAGRTVELTAKLQEQPSPDQLPCLARDGSKWPYSPPPQSYRQFWDLLQLTNALTRALVANIMASA